MVHPPPLLHTIQVTLLTLHEHIGSSPIIKDYTSNTAYPSRTHWFILPHYYILYKYHCIPFTNTLVHPPLLQTMQVTLLTLHDHIGSSPIITDYTSNTAYPSRTHWFIPHYYRLQVTLLTLHEHICASPIITDYTSNTAYPSRTHWFIPDYYRLYR